MTTCEAHCAESSVLKELLYISTGEGLGNITRSDFLPYGYHVGYDSRHEVQSRILTRVDDNVPTYSKVNWL